jgi:hypothetical protein
MTLLKTSDISHLEVDASIFLSILPFKLALDNAN